MMDTVLDAPARTFTEVTEARVSEGDQLVLGSGNYGSPGEIAGTPARRRSAPETPRFSWTASVPARARCGTTGPIAASPGGRVRSDRCGTCLPVLASGAPALSAGYETMTALPIYRRGELAHVCALYC